LIAAWTDHTSASHTPGVVGNVHRHAALLQIRSIPRRIFTTPSEYPLHHIRAAPHPPFGGTWPKRSFEANHR
jgi:hypothetical protein